MIISINNPKGIDYQIGQLVSWLQANLLPAWGLDPLVDADNEKFIFYPRVYRNKIADGFIAEVYTGDKNYKEVYYDDRIYGSAFFGLSSKIDHQSGEDLVEIHLVAWGNVKQLYPAIAHRADNEFRLDFESLLTSPLFGFILESTEIGLSNVLREYPGSRREDRLVAADMGDVHAFRLNLNLRFNPSASCNNPSL